MVWGAVSVMAMGHDATPLAPRLAEMTDLRAHDWRCSDFTRAEHVDPVGSAGEHDAFFLIETPLPWPHEALEAPLLAPLVPLVDAARSSGHDARVMAVVPHAEGGPLRVVHRRRASGQGYGGTDHLVEREGLADLVAALLADPEAVLPSAAGPSPDELLVCTHGRRDVCCGGKGTVLHEQVAQRWPGTRVWRCSHTGGHRFAPTGITFPDGRYWAFLDVALLDAIEARSDVAPLLPHYRGLAGLDMWQQAVERELFARFGWAWLNRPISATTSSVSPEGADVELSSGDLLVRARVAVRRVVPILDCGNPPEQAKKSAPELEVRDLTVEGDSAEVRP
jgi:hypothetical protein